MLAVKTLVLLEDTSTSPLAFKTVTVVDVVVLSNVTEVSLNSTKPSALSITHSTSLASTEQFEEKELDLNNALHLLKLSYRAFCASIAQEKRRNLFYNINPEINTFCSGPLFDEQRAYSTYVIEIYEKYRDDMFQHVKKKNSSDYIFKVVRMSRKRLCLSDVYVAENILSDAYGRKEDNPKLFPIFIHALPYENESILIYGYDKRQCNSSVIFYIEKWSESIPDDIITEWLVMTDKWCVAPSFFGDNAEDCCAEIFRRKYN